MPLTVSCFSEIRLVLPFWYRLTQVVLDKGLLNRCVCMWVRMYSTCCILVMTHTHNRLTAFGLGLGL